MWRWQRIILSCLCAFSFAQSTNALDIGLGSTIAPRGTTATVTIQFSNAPTNEISAFALYLTNHLSLGLPTVTPGADQTNLTCFVDSFAGGVYRVTGFILSGASISNGHIASLHFTIPTNTAGGDYPIAFAAVPPPNAPAGSNPETRSIRESALIGGTATGGLITVITVPGTAPVITGISAQSGQVYLLQFQGESGFSYTVQASSNLVDWFPVMNLPAASNSLFQLMETNSTSEAARFYRLVFP